MGNLILLESIKDSDKPWARAKFIKWKLFHCHTRTSVYLRSKSSDLFCKLITYVSLGSFGFSNSGIHVIILNIGYSGEKKLQFFLLYTQQLSYRSIIYIAVVKYVLNFLPWHCGIKLLLNVWWWLGTTTGKLNCHRNEPIKRPHCHQLNQFVSRFVAPGKLLLFIAAMPRKLQRKYIVEATASTVSILLIKSVIML